MINGKVPQFALRESGKRRRAGAIAQIALNHHPMHRSHNYKHLIQRWRCVAQSASLKLTRFATSSEWPVYFLRTSRAPETRTIYISAGIHGDEPAGCEAMIAWAEKNLGLFKSQPFVLFPCLNPWGLINNSRVDDHGRDLNRGFGKRPGASPVRELKRLIRGEKFALSLTLHEDYDGQGVYVYEVQRDRPFWGEELLEVAHSLIAVEPRRMIDGRRARGGLVRRTIDLKKFPLIPEAVYLHLRHSHRTFTIETPSEFALETRVAVQVAIMEECIRRSLNEVAK
jgi:murein peptide amidase A